MAISTILELRILPPLAIARFGSSPEPLENYSLVVPNSPDYRRIQAAPTFVVNQDTGAIDQKTAPDPNKKVEFRDAQKRVKPLAPFLEVWARFEPDGLLEPLAKEHLSALGLTPSDVTWSARAANIKAFRRTGDPGDRVEAKVGPFSDHESHDIIGNAQNFKISKTITLGSLRFIRPTDTFPQIRLRFTPAAGRVFGPRESDALLVDDVYAGFTACPSPPDGFNGNWDRYWIGKPGTPPETAPGDIFQGQPVGDNKLSDGYLDDTCDGILSVELTFAGRTLRADARFMSSLPDFAPDTVMLRTIADDLEQMAFGPDVPVPNTDAEKAAIKKDVEDTVRRALETVRPMNTKVQNGEQNVGGVADNQNNMSGQQTGYGRDFEPIYSPGTADYPFVVSAHQALLLSALQAAKLEGSFTHADRLRPADEIGNLTEAGRRRMPAMMRGSDGLELALTRRQIAKLNLAAAPSAAPGLAALETPAAKLLATPAPTITTDLVSAIRRIPIARHRWVMGRSTLRRPPVRPPKP